MSTKSTDSLKEPQKTESLSQPYEYIKGNMWMFLALLCMIYWWMLVQIYDWLIDWIVLFIFVLCNLVNVINVSVSDIILFSCFLIDSCFMFVSENIFYHNSKEGTHLLSYERYILKCCIIQIYVNILIIIVIMLLNTI